MYENLRECLTEIVGKMKEKNNKNEKRFKLPSPFFAIQIRNLLYYPL